MVLTDFASPELITKLPQNLFEKPLHGVQLIPVTVLPDKTVATKRNPKRFSLKVSTAQAVRLNRANCFWRNEQRGERYQSLIEFYGKAENSIVNIACEGSGQMHFSRHQGKSQLHFAWQKEGTEPAHYLQTIGLSYWLERQGVPCIHGNALAYGDKAVAIIAPSQTGKTTLSAALMQVGFALMSDDMMALHRQAEQWQIYPGWPNLRMWPDSLAQFESREGLRLKPLPKVHGKFNKCRLNIAAIKPEYFCESKKPLHALYLLNREAPDNAQTKCKISRLKPAQGLMQLLKNSMLADAYRVMGIEENRLEILSPLLQQVPIYTVNYPSGAQYLTPLCELLKQHVQGDYIF